MEVNGGRMQITVERGGWRQRLPGLDSVNDGADGLCCAVTDGSSCFLILCRRRGPQETKRKEALHRCSQKRQTDGRTDYIYSTWIVFREKIPLAVGKDTKILHSGKRNQAPSPPT